MGRWVWQQRTQLDVPDDNMNANFFFSSFSPPWPPNTVCQRFLKFFERGNTKGGVQWSEKKITKCGFIFAFEVLVQTLAHITDKRSTRNSIFGFPRISQKSIS